MVESFEPPARALDGLDARYDHVAVAAPRIRDLLPVYQDLLGGRFVLGGDNSRVGYRALQLGFADGARVELMEPLGDSNFFDRFFQRTGGGGMHHITFLVPDMHQALRGVEQLGFTPTSVFLDDPEWQEVFLHPKETHGTLVQLVRSGIEGEVRSTLEDMLAGRGPSGNGVPSP